MVNKAISLVTFVHWFERNKEFFECKKSEHIDLQAQIRQIESTWLNKQNVRSVRIASAKPLPQKSSKDLLPK